MDQDELIIMAASIILLAVGMGALFFRDEMKHPERRAEFFRRLIPRLFLLVFALSAVFWVVLMFTVPAKRPGGKPSIIRTTPTAPQTQSAAP